jgi:hypothetical protein
MESLLSLSLDWIFSSGRFTSLFYRLSLGKQPLIEALPEGQVLSSGKGVIKQEGFLSLDFQQSPPFSKNGIAKGPLKKSRRRSKGGLRIRAKRP